MKLSFSSSRVPQSTCATIAGARIAWSSPAACSRFENAYLTSPSWGCPRSSCFAGVFALATRPTILSLGGEVELPPGAPSAGSRARAHRVIVLQR